MFAWSRTAYVEWRGIVFNFEWLTDKRYFLDHMPDARSINFKEAYELADFNTMIRVPASSTLCLDTVHKARQKKVREWVMEVRERNRLSLNENK